MKGMPLQKYLVIMFAVLTASSLVFADTDDNVCMYREQTLPSLTCYGSTLLKNMIVNGEVVIAGPLKTEQTSLQSLHMSGPAQLVSTKIQGKAFIAGPLTATNSYFKSDLLITGDKAVLTASTVKNPITITSNEVSPTLELACRTFVDSIKFEGKPGVVLMTKDSFVRGKIYNGNIQKIDRQCPAAIVACL